MKVFTSLTAILLCTAWMAYGQWTYTSLSMPKAYMGATALGTKAYLAGGMNDTGLKSTVEIYDSSTGQWDTTQHLSVARDLVSATTCGSKIFFAGGVDFFSTGNAYSTVDIFDTENQSWSIDSLSVPRFNVAAFSHGSKVYFVGGVDTQLGIVYDVVDIYDLETQEWTVTNLGEPRVSYVGVVGDLAILPGGVDASGVTKRVDIFNFSTGTWSIDSLSVARAWVGIATVENKMLIAGGATSGNIQSDVVDIYDASTGTWTTASLSLARSFSDGQNAVTACGKAYFVGGGKLNLNGPYWDEAYNRIDIYDPVTDGWSVDSLVDSYVHRAVVSTGDQYIVAGGVYYGYFSDVEIYTCPPPSCLPEGITFTTQEQIDNFQTNYPGCTEIEGDVTISGYDITNLNGLNILTSNGGGLNISENDALTSLAGLESLISIGGEFRITYNSSLTSLAGLDNVQANSIDSLFIINNAVLSECDVQSICDYLATPGAQVNIYDNAPGCNSPEEVTQACQAISVKELEAGCQKLEVTIWPNPFDDDAMIEYELYREAMVTMSVSNHLGQQVAVLVSEQQQTGKNRVQWHASGLPDGVYYYRLQAGHDVVTGKMILIK